MSANNIFPLLLLPLKCFHLANREISQYARMTVRITSTPGGLQCRFMQRDHQIAFKTKIEKIFDFHSIAVKSHNIIF